MKEWLFVFNPHAGKGKAAKKLSAICKLLDSQKILYDMIVTSQAKHAVLITKEYIDKGCRKIIAVGGDGTINEVITGIITSGKAEEIKLGIIPLGGGNDFVKNFSIPNDIKTAIEVLINDNITYVDVAKFDDYYFINSFGLGFDAQVAGIAIKINFINGLLRYLLAVLGALLYKKSVTVEIEIDDISIKKKCLLVSIGNGRFVGGGFQLTPNADPRDRLLDVCVIEDVSIFRILTLLPAAIKGNHVTEKEVKIHKASRIKLKTRSSCSIYYDGEIPDEVENREHNIEILNERINLIVASE